MHTAFLCSKLLWILCDVSDRPYLCGHVIGIDIDLLKIDYARHNAAIYGVDDHIDFIMGYFFLLAPKLKT
ncbi:Trimethylguanosine synthase [Spatholobus suberectus]|nr:Trimethylguanosine synthase [Spatholobus suberectus]